MNQQELSTIELVQMILGDFDSQNNTEVALESFLFAKKIANAASVAMKVTQEYAVKKLLEQGGKGSNTFSSFNIVREFERVFQPNEQRDSVVAELESETALIKAIKERLGEIEKEMEKAGQVAKKEIGQTIKVTMLEKI